MQISAKQLRLLSTLLEANSSGELQIKSASISGTYLANDSVSEPALAVSNSPTADYLLSWNGSAMAWATLAVAAIADDLITEPKLAISNAPTANYVLYYDSVAGMTWGAIVNALIADGTITEAKLDIDNSPTDGYALLWSATAGKPMWSALPADTDSKVAASASDPSPRYLDQVLTSSQFTSYVDTTVYYVKIKDGGVGTDQIADLAVTAGKLANGIDATTKSFNADQVDGKDVNDSDTTTASLWTASKILQSIRYGFFKDAVTSILTTPPGSPGTGDRYLVNSAATGDWAGYENYIAEYDGSAWAFDAPADGNLIWDNNTRDFYYYNSGSVSAFKWAVVYTLWDLDNIADGSSYTRVAGVNASHLITNSSIADATIGVAKIDTYGTITDGYVLAWNATQSKMEWVALSAGSDTYMVKIDAAATAVYGEGIFSTTYFQKNSTVMDIKAGSIGSTELGSGVVDVNKLAASIDASSIAFNADKVDGADVNDSGLTTASLWTAAKILAYIRDYNHWQVAVIDKDLTAPPVSPVLGDRYIVGAGATGDWSGHDNAVAEYDGSAWVFTTPIAGFALWVTDEARFYRYTSSWGYLEASLVHASLGSLQGGTTGQYYHLTLAQHTDLTDGGSCTIHTHDLDTLGSPAYANLQNWWDVTQGSGVLSGATISDNSDGTVAVAAGEGIIKTTDSAVGDTKFFVIPAADPVSLTDASTNYIYVDYNSGTPTVGASTTDTANGRSILNIGRVYRDGTALDILHTSQNSELFRTIQRRLKEAGKFQVASGGVVAESATRYITITAASMWFGLANATQSAFDSSVTNFSYWYHSSGVWTRNSSASQIDNTQYDNGTDLATLSTGYYGVHWVYLHYSGQVSVVYGRGDYTLAAARAANPPTLPSAVSDFSALVGKVIILKSASAFTAVEDHTSLIPVSGITSHSELGGLSADDHSQYHNDTRGDARYLQISNNLSDVADAATARTNLGITSGTTLNKYDATAAPTVTDDSSAGYSVGSEWIDVTNDAAYRCVDATTGSAIWTLVTPALTHFSDTTPTFSSGTNGKAIVIVSGKSLTDVVTVSINGMVLPDVYYTENWSASGATLAGSLCIHDSTASSVPGGKSQLTWEVESTDIIKVDTYAVI